MRLRYSHDIPVTGIFVMQGLTSLHHHVLEAVSSVADFQTKVYYPRVDEIGHFALSWKLIEDTKFSGNKWSRYKGFGRSSPFTVSLLIRLETLKADVDLSSL